MTISGAGYTPGGSVSVAIERPDHEVDALNPPENADGTFSTVYIPPPIPGRYKITAVSERAQAVSVDATSTAGASTAPEVTLDETSWGFAQHKNKFGKDYPAAAYQK